MYKDPHAATCDRIGCECLARIDMTVVAPSPVCAECGKSHQLARINIFLYLCEPHAREIGHPTTVLDPETMELTRQAFREQGFEDIDFARSVWEYAPLPDEVAVRAH